jgi:5-methylcytosine-specific restriction endonuclease McrA
VKKRKPKGAKSMLWCQLDKKQCYLCGEHLVYKEASVDHIIPRCKGGSDGYDNLQLAHVRCNQLKGSDMPSIYIVMIGYLTKGKKAGAGYKHKY